MAQILLIHIQNVNCVVTRANTYTSGDQTDPTVVYALDGGFYVVWTSLGQVNDYDVFAQRFDKNGIKIGSETLVNTGYSSGDQSQSNATTLTSGKLVVVWHTSRNSSWEIYGKIFNADLTVAFSEYTMNTITSNDQSYPCVCSLANDAFLVVYREFKSGDRDVWAVMYNGNKELILGSFLVNTIYRTSDQGYNKVACVGLSSGKYVITYSSKGQDGSAEGIYGKIYNSDNIVLKDEFLINTTTDKAQVGNNMAFSKMDEFIVTWDANQTNSSRIYFKIFDEAGNVIKDETTANTLNMGQQFNAVVYSIGGTKAFVCWRGNYPSCSAYEIQCKLIDFKGNFISKAELRMSWNGNYDKVDPTVTTLKNLSNVIAWNTYGIEGSNQGVYFDFNYSYQLVNSVFTDVQENPYITALNNGGYIITWTCAGCDGSDNACLGQIFDGTGKKNGEEFIINKTTTKDQENCKSAVLSNNNIFLVWQSLNQDKFDVLLTKNLGIYGKIISQEGQLVKDEFLINTDTYN